ncbi:MAG: hypothetical protein IJE43_20020 [Alphaproteobacteria bacterium]|nr:hypothetical protein [Alphaproteobacteria bacterium]
MLTTLLAFIIGLFINIGAVYAQNSDDVDLLSEMDILMDEKKKEAKTTENNDVEETTFSEKFDKKKKNKNESESWLSSFLSGMKKADDVGIEKNTEEDKKRIERVKRNIRSNAANFDISKIRLRMKPEQVNKILEKQGYRRIVQTFAIPNFIRWRSEELCRLNGVIGFERLNACATGVSKENGYQYIDKEVYNRFSTKESLTIHYTSTFTDNVAHHIFYKSYLPMSESRASNRVYINNLKIYDFWQRISFKYGEPDNKSEIKWGLGGKKPYLKASTGALELADPLLVTLDSKRMFNEDTRLSNIQYYHF